jgi:Protein of unknown function (DUF2959)
MSSLPARLFLAVLCFLTVAGCHDTELSPSFETSSRNRLAVLARNMTSTLEAQQAAAEKISTGVQTIKTEAWTGADPADAYDVARRVDTSSETRVRNARGRIKVVQSNGEDLFSQWAKENDEYTDKDLKESSRQNRLKVKATFDAAIEQMKKADEATEPALAAIRDQVLFLKHHRNSPTVPERPSFSADPALPAEALVKATNLAATLTQQFVDSAQTPK